MEVRAEKPRPCPEHGAGAWWMGVSLSHPTGASDFHGVVPHRVVLPGGNVSRVGDADDLIRPHLCHARAKTLTGRDGKPFTLALEDELIESTLIGDNLFRLEVRPGERVADRVEYESCREVFRYGFELPLIVIHGQ